ncbi:hypothetical protein R3P38DRAFT_3305049 [Favolaschia claudopus]|uniref:Uncharacterized protein n=1 Tax=Favolaschia claudopus TaxID=2862362 RepID=A0AAW0DUT7_9AGAR
MPATQAFPAHHAPVPLTTHHLHREDRARLMRSTRKIEDVVGETPHFSTSKCQTHPPPTQRRRRFHTVTFPNADVTLNLRYAVARDDVTRRRKMAKLRRTLGDNRSSGSGSGSRRASRLRDKDREREGESDISRGWVWVGKREDIPPEESGLPFDWVLCWEDRGTGGGRRGRPRMGAYPAMSNGGGGRRGEWDAGSARNMDQVVSRLRDLKVK